MAMKTTIVKNGEYWKHNGHRKHLLASQCITIIGISLTLIMLSTTTLVGGSFIDTKHTLRYDGEVNIGKFFRQK